MAAGAAAKLLEAEREEGWGWEEASHPTDAVQ